MSETSLPAAGWFVDPEDATLFRYWDGNAWTEHRAPATQPSTEVVAVTQPGAASVESMPGILGRILKRKQADSAQLPPSLAEVIAGCVLERPRHPLDEQVEVVGETYHVKGIKRVFAEAGMPITSKGSTLEQTLCALVPELWNPHDPNAVAVCVGSHQVGHLPADLAIDYAAALVTLARQKTLVTGEARIWAKSDGGVVRARVTILIPEASSL